MSNTTSCTVNKAVSLFPLPNDLSDGAKFPLETDLDRMVSSMLLSVQTKSGPLNVVPIGSTANEPAPIGSNATAAASTITMPAPTTIPAPLNVVPIGMTATAPAPVTTSTVIEAPLPQVIPAAVPAPVIPAEVPAPVIPAEVPAPVIPAAAPLVPAEDVIVGEASGEPLVFNPITPNATISSIETPKVEGFTSNLKQKLGLSMEGFSNAYEEEGMSMKKIIILVVVLILCVVIGGVMWFFGWDFFPFSFYGRGSYMGRRGFF
jgi:hypothetical protein